MTVFQRQEGYVRILVPFLSVVCVAACEKSPGPAERIAFPELFNDNPACPESADPLTIAVRAEEQAGYRHDRYPYDPRDGVRSVRELGIAAACYDLAGRSYDAARLRTLRSQVRARISIDYSSARLSLSRAISSKDWNRALAETRRLQLLTSHLGGHDYVDWLRQTNGRATSRVQSMR